MTEVVPISRAIARATRQPMRRGVPAVAWYSRGCALEARDPDAALAAYARAIAGRPDLADAWNNTGRVLHDRGDLGAAEANYRIAICIDASVALYWFNLGVVVEDGGGRAAEATAAYERAVELDGDCADAHYNLARLCEHEGRAAGDAGWALSLYRRAMRHYVRYRQLVRLHKPIFK
jgi:tetratricopeptide (TPR) repeat protein